METLAYIIHTLEIDFWCEVIRNKELHLENGNDIDMVIRSWRYSEVKQYLSHQWFALLYESEMKIHAYRFIGWYFVHIDILISIKYIKKYMNIDAHIDICNEDVASRFLRYLLLLRTSKKDFINSHKHEIIQHGFFLDFLTVSPFSHKVDFQIIQKVIQRNLLSLFRYLKFRYFFSYIVWRIREYLSVWNTGKTIAFLWPDGSGKSTIIEMLVENLWGEKYYMGGREFVLEKFYQRYEKNIFLKLPIFLLRYWENWWRYIRVKMAKIKWRLVFLDRYPKRELVTSVQNSNINHLLHFVFYKFLYPRPDITIVIDVPTGVILQRKKELTKEEIENVKAKLQANVLAETATYRIENIDLDYALNEILHTIFSRWK